MIMYALARIQKKLRLVAKKNSKTHPKSRICSGSQVVDSIIGRYSYIGYDCIILNTRIGEFTSIANDVCIGLASHPTKWVSTSPLFHSGQNVFKSNFSRTDYLTQSVTTIGNDVWIGARALIKSGVNVSNGAIIGMGSVLTKDVGPYEIWAGNPAKFIKKRFDEDMIAKLIESEWWSFDEKKLADLGDSFCQPEDFVKRLL